MINLFTKWGSVIILIFVIGTIVMAIASGAGGLSSWLGDTYLPKKYLIIEKYPVRIIMYGQFENPILSKKENQPATNMEADRTVAIIKIINALNNVKFHEGKFEYDISINVNSDFNSRQIRSSNRAVKKIEKYVEDGE